MSMQYRHLRTRLALTVSILAVLTALPASVALARGDVVDVELRELPAEDAWQASFHLPAKAAGVDFVHGRGNYRRASWSVAPAGSQWTDASDSPEVERLCFPRPTRELGVSFRSDFARRPKDYEAQVAMSDGGRLFYTGQLLVRPLERCAAGTAATPAAGPVVRRFRFTTAEERTIRVPDAAAAMRTLTWQPAIGSEETYVYFGPRAAASGERVALVVDPALPAALRNDLEPTIAKLLERFAGETGLALPSRPLVLLGFDPRGSGRSFDGGVLGGVVQLAAAGEGWLRDDAETRQQWTIRLAHELFHLWDGALLHADAESEWLAEAAAEAFALRAAYGLGVLTDKQVAERLVDLGNQCLAGLDGQPLLSAPQRRAWETWYSCGPVLLFVAGQAVEHKQPGKGGLGLLVREMFAEGQRAGGVYGTGTFLGWLDKLSEDRPTVFALQGVIRRGAPRGADRLLAQLLAGAGYRVQLAAPADAKASPEVFGTMLRKGLARCACGPSGAPAVGADGAAEDGDCARLSGQARIARIGDVEVSRDPASAYERLRSAAGLGRPLRITTDDDAPPLTLFCGRDTLDPSFEQLLRLAP